MADKQMLEQWETIRTQFEKFQIEVTKSETIKEQYLKQAEQVKKEIFETYQTTDIEELRKIYRDVELQDKTKVEEFLQKYEIAKKQLQDLKNILAEIPTI